MPVPASIPAAAVRGVAAVSDRWSESRDASSAEFTAVQTTVVDRTTKFNPLARALVGLIWVYQKTLSPVLPAVFGPACGCRFYPTCSHYAAEAVRTHGALTGTWLAARRLIKCTPLHPGGLDPVPPARPPRCTRVTA